MRSFHVNARKPISSYRYKSKATRVLVWHILFERKIAKYLLSPSGCVCFGNMGGRMNVWVTNRKFTREPDFENTTFLQLRKEDKGVLKKPHRRRFVRLCVCAGAMKIYRTSSICALDGRSYILYIEWRCPIWLDTVFVTILGHTTGQWNIYKL